MYLYGFNILVNGKQGQLIHPERGIRQDDHISRYIFIICAKYLGRYIHFTGFHPHSHIDFRLNMECPNIPCLIFTDDYIICCRVTKKAAIEIKYVLDHYCNVSCQWINYHRSTIQFSIGVEKSVKSDIADILLVKNTGSIGSYLNCFRPSRDDFSKLKTQV